MSIKKKKYFQRAVREIVNALKKYEPEKIILFGSALGSKFNEDSDIDLLVIKKTDEPFWRRQIKAALLYRGWVPTDIFVVTPDELKKAISDNRFFVTEEILKKGKVIYEKYN